MARLKEEILVPTSIPILYKNSFEIAYHIFLTCSFRAWFWDIFSFFQLSSLSPTWLIKWWVDFFFLVVGVFKVKKVAALFTFVGTLLWKAWLEKTTTLFWVTISIFKLKLILILYKLHWCLYILYFIFFFAISTQNN